MFAVAIYRDCRIMIILNHNLEKCLHEAQEHQSQMTIPYTCSIADLLCNHVLRKLLLKSNHYLREVTITVTAGKGQACSAFSRAATSWMRAAFGEIGHCNGCGIFRLQ